MTFWSTRNLMELIIQTEDGGEIGRCKDLLADDRFWGIRYLVADTRKWLPGRKVLISCSSVREPDPDLTHIPVKMTREQIDACPSLDEDALVSRRYEKQYFEHFGWPPYWVGMGPWGVVSYPYQAFEMQQKLQGRKDEDPEKSHLRSIKELTDYTLQAQDEEIGHLHECMMDMPSWMVRYLVVDISKWYQLKGRKVLIIPECVTHIDWGEEKIRINIAKDDITNCPEYKLESPLERDFEMVLHEYYGWPKYLEGLRK